MVIVVVRGWTKSKFNLMSLSTGIRDSYLDYNLAAAINQTLRPNCLN
jgi:hypothetical protein